MTRNLLLALSIGVVAIGVACDASDTDSARVITQRDSAGIAVVRVLHPPSDTIRPNAPTLRIGSTGLNGPDHEVFELLTDVAVLPGGRIVVVDNRGARVALFDSTGGWLRDIGGVGEGPSEYTGPLYARTRADTIFVWDALQRRFLRYLADGTVVGSTTVLERGGARPFYPLEDGYVVEVESGQMTDPDPAQGALIQIQRNGEFVDTLVGPYEVPERGWVSADDGSGSGHMTNPPALAIYPPWTVASGHVFSVDPNASTVRVYDLDMGGLRQLIRMPYVAQPPTDRDRDAYFEGLQAQFGFPDEIIARERQQTEFATLRPSLADVLVDEGSRVWLARHDSRARGNDYIGSSWDVIDVERGTVVHVEFPEGFLLEVIQGGQAYGTTTLPNGIHVLDVFEVGQRN